MINRFGRFGQCLREIPCGMLARRAVQPRVLVALIIQCATMAIEVVEGDNFDESSDEKVEEDSTLLQGEIGSSATFLIGARIQYGRAVRFNNHLLYLT